MAWWRRARAALVITGTWAAFWAAAGTALGVGLLVTRAAPQLPNLEAAAAANAGWIAGLAGSFAAVGALSGLCFAGLLLVFERRASLGAFSRRRSAAWGVASALSWLLVALTAEFVGTGQIAADAPEALLLYGALAGASAYVTIRLAQRAARRATSEGPAAEVPAI